MDDFGVHRRHDSAARETESVAIIHGAQIHSVVFAKRNASLVTTDEPTSTLRQARALLGQYLVRRWRNTEIVSMITEVEAYDGLNDKASHASRGMTSRNAVMFGPEGVWYVYLCYGMHWILNYVVGEEGYPAAILIRGTVDAHGPGRLTKHFHVTLAQNGMIAAPESSLWIENRGVAIDEKRIVAAPRIGIPYAQEWQEKPMRFTLNV